VFRRVVNAIEVLAVVAVAVFIIMLFANEPGSGGAAASSPGGMIFSANCASCHGANGEGAIGPKLAGVVVPAFPNPSDEITFVDHGRGIMPAFATTLSAAQIRDVVDYTRTELGK
jgi:mono/diheme cytochrome c family protein